MRMQGNIGNDIGCHQFHFVSNNDEGGNKQGASACEFWTNKKEMWWAAPSIQMCNIPKSDLVIILLCDCKGWRIFFNIFPSHSKCCQYWKWGRQKQLTCRKCFMCLLHLHNQFFLVNGDFKFAVQSVWLKSSKRKGQWCRHLPNC